MVAVYQVPSTLTSTASMPLCWAQATPAIVTRPGGQAAPGLRHVDARFGLDRALLGPAPPHPVGVERAERGELHVDHPLGRRHVAVQARHHHADRVAVRRGSGWPFMPTASRDSRPSMTGSVATPMVMPLTSRMTIWSAPGLDPRLAEQRGQQRALPAGVADVAAADALRDAGQGDVVLDHRHLQQLVERDRHRVVDHAVDAQLPGGGRDLRDGQGRVDPVELGVRREERGQARDVQRVFRRQRLLLDDPRRRDLHRRRARHGGLPGTAS